MTEPQRIIVESGEVNLHVLMLGDPANPPLVVLHGMRDVALSLMPVAHALAQQYRVCLPDLRGHGHSDQPGSYAMPEFIVDLHRVITQLMDSPPAIIGHSLGGQIATRFAALFPDQVRAAVIVEGLGPPGRPHLADPAVALKMEGARILETFAKAVPRPLPGVEFAAERLLANNPRLDPGYALTLARQATQKDAAGNLVWAFDPRVSTVFLSVTPGESERYWRGVKCPTLVISGAHAGEYWGRALGPGASRNGGFRKGELQERLECFEDHEHIEFASSGHMVHFDEPDRLVEAARNFLRRHL